MADFDLDRFLAEDHGGPVVMLNLLRFARDGGRERYDEYRRALLAHGRGADAELLYFGAGRRARRRRARTGTPSRSCRYPSRQAFADMVRSPEYRAIEHLRA